MNPVLNYTTIIQARRKLEELATARQRQETTLAALTAEYHTITGTAEKVLAQAEHQAHQQLTTARNNAAHAAHTAETTIRKMLNTGATPQNIAERLHLSVPYIQNIANHNTL